MSVVVTGDSKFGQPTYIVAHSIALGATHTTIQAAINDAVVGDTIAIKGSAAPYIENLTGKAGITLNAFIGDGYQNIVNVVGTLVMNATGSMGITGITFTSPNNGSATVSMTGANVSALQFTECVLNATGAVGLSVTNPNASIGFSDCVIGILDNHALFSWAGSGLTVEYCQVAGTPGVSLTSSTISSGFVAISYSSWQTPITSSGTAQVIAIRSGFGGSGAFNLTWITAGGSGAINRADHCSFYSGSASCISVSGGSTYGLYECVLDSSNTNYVTGAGILATSACTYSNTGTTVNVATITPNKFGIQGTWTPTLSFGGSSTGITYTKQEGHYIIIGKLVFGTVDIQLSSKGAQTGAASIGGLPFISASFTDLAGSGAMFYNLLTLDAGFTQVNLTVLVATTGLAITESGSTKSAQSLADTNFNNTTQITGSFVYQTS